MSWKFEIEIGDDVGFVGGIAKREVVDSDGVLILFNERGGRCPGRGIEDSGLSVEELEEAARRGEAAAELLEGGGQRQGGLEAGEDGEHKEGEEDTVELAVANERDGHEENHPGSGVHHKGAEGFLEAVEMGYALLRAEGRLADKIGLVSLVGSLTKNKGIGEALEALDEVGIERGPRAGDLLAGRLAEQRADEREDGSR